MSNKPKKHSEAKREWQSSAKRMRGHWGSPRASVPTIPINPERHLIVTEGEKAEPNYFGAIRERINECFHGRWVTVEVRGKG